MSTSRSSTAPGRNSLLLASLAVALSLVGCGGGSGTETTDGGTRSGAAVSQPGELTAYVQQRMRTLNAQGQLGYFGNPAAGGDVLPVGLPVAVSGGAAPPAARSSTLLQEAGVDEADLIQSDGNYLYTLQPSRGAGPTVTAYQRGSDGRATRLAAVDVPMDGATSLDTDGMHLTDDHKTLAVVARAWTSGPPLNCGEVCIAIAPQWIASGVTVQRVNVSTPAALALGDRVQIDGSLVDSRRIGNQLYVVTTWRPSLTPQYLPASATAAEREAAITALKPADVLPRLRRNGGASEPLMSETDCYVRNANASTTVQLTTVTVFDLASTNLARTSRCFVGGTEALYMSANNLYLATTAWPVPVAAANISFPTDFRTDIHKFALGGGTVTYKGSGNVAGHLGWDREKTALRLSEHNGDLRVLSFTGSWGWFTVADAGTAAPSPATLSVLRERASDQTLQTVATLPNSSRPASIGKPNEQVYAVRFLGDRAYVVTFRRTDPLYVLDLSNPADPRTAGELEIAGFSEYLYPMPGGQLLGAGRDADSTGRITGLKFALFDVNDPARPTERAAITVGNVGSGTALDSSRHGLNMLQVGNVARVAVPAIVTSSPYGDYRHGLLKLEVDTTAGTIRNLGVAGGDTMSYAQLWLERSLQIGDNVYYLSGGALTSLSW